ncbi:hypothetical protein ACFZAE_06710 [Streptomyces scabiei]|uniref:hypothetical protein n=1 Tax=Streptomyces scabiei TaxID=1930 RepID=UPI0036EB01FB
MPAPLREPVSQPVPEPTHDRTADRIAEWEGRRTLALLPVGARRRGEHGARERIDLLPDAGSFTETGPFVRARPTGDGTRRAYGEASGVIPLENGGGDVGAHLGCSANADAAAAFAATKV